MLSFSDEMSSYWIKPENYSEVAYVAKWLDYSPFTSKVASSNPSSVLGPSPHVKRAQVNALRKVVGFLRVLRFPPTGKVDRVG